MVAKTKYYEGLPVHDAKKALPFEIIASDVSKGKRNGRKNASKCVGAIGLCRSQSTSDARVNLSRTLVKDSTGKKWIRYQTGLALRTQIVSLDQGGTFQVGEYTLRPFHKSKHLGERRGSPKDTSKRKPVRRRTRNVRVTEVRPQAQRPTLKAA